MSDARKMLQDYAAAGVDGLILVYEDDLPDAFLNKLDTVRALIDR